MKIHPEDHSQKHGVNLLIYYGVICCETWVIMGIYRVYQSSPPDRMNRSLKLWTLGIGVRIHLFNTPSWVHSGYLCVYIIIYFQVAQSVGNDIFKFSEFLMLAKLNAELQQLKTRVYLSQQESKRLSLRYAKRMVIISNFLLAAMSFFFHFSRCDALFRFPKFQYVMEIQLVLCYCMVFICKLLGGFLKLTRKTWTLDPFGLWVDCCAWQ